MTRKIKSTFTRREKINLIESRKAVLQTAAAIVEAVAIEKNRIAAEKRERELASKVRKLLLANPEQKKLSIKTKRDGTAYVQLRGEKGKILPATIL